jgi:hypothetical protein
MLVGPFHFGSPPSVLNPYYVGVLFSAIFLLALWNGRRQPLTVAVAVASVISWCLSMHYRSIAGVPVDRLIKSLPIVGNVAIVRLIIPFWFGAIIVIVLSAVAVRDRQQWDFVPRTWWLGLGVTTLVSTLLGVCLLNAPLALGYPRDAAVAQITHMPGRHVVATFPFPVEHQAMMLQAEAGDFSYHLADIYTYAIFGQFPALQRDAAVFTKIHQDKLLSAPSRRQLDLGRVALRQMGVTDVVLPRGSIASVGPGAQTDANTNEFVAFFTEMLGRPSVLDGEWVWRHLGQSHHSMTALGTAQWRTCALRTAAGRIPQCVVRQS